MAARPRALYVGIRDDGRHHLTYDGYPKTLQAYGWQATHLTHREAEAVGPNGHDLILWNGTIPESFLKAIGNNQTLCSYERCRR